MAKHIKKPKRSKPKRKSFVPGALVKLKQCSYEYCSCQTNFRHHSMYLDDRYGKITGHFTYPEINEDGIKFEQLVYRIQYVGTNTYDIWSKEHLELI